MTDIGYKKHIFIMIALAAILLAAGIAFCHKNQVYSCSGQQKIYLRDNEFMNVHVKINAQHEKISIKLIGFHHQEGAPGKRIYRQGIYRISPFHDGIYESTLLEIRRFFNDNSPEYLNDYLFGIRTGQSRNIRIKALRKGLLMFGSEHTWIYAVAWITDQNMHH
ncbi:hypothetical protein ACMGOD_004382 [Klebsiella oxytoca]